MEIWSVKDTRCSSKKPAVAVQSIEVYVNGLCEVMCLCQSYIEMISIKSYLCL